MEFAILGPLTVRSRAGVVALGGDKRRALLALLLLHANEPMSAERLAVALWGDDTPVGAVKTVRVHVSRLRASLEERDVLVTTPAGYLLRVGEGECDAERFERLLEQGRRELADGAVEQAAASLGTALSLWRGPALADLRYEPFAQSAIARLEELRWDAIEARNAADLELGRVDAVLADVEGPTGDAPCASGWSSRGCKRSTARVARWRRSRSIEMRGVACTTSSGSSRGGRCASSSTRS